MQGQKDIKSNIMTIKLCKQSLAVWLNSYYLFVHSLLSLCKCKFYKSNFQLHNMSEIRSKYLKQLNNQGTISNSTGSVGRFLERTWI